MKTGTGTLTLSGNNTYTGGTFINSGTVVLSGGSSINGSYTIGNGATLQVTASSFWFNGNPSFNFTTNGGGTIDTYSGVNFIMGGASTYTSLGGTQDLIKGSSGINLNGNTATFNVARGTDPTADLLVSTYLWTGGSLVKNGNGIMLLSATNTYTGKTTVSGGTLSITGQILSTLNGAYANAVTVNTGGTLQFNSWLWGGSGGSFGTLYYDANAFVINGGTLTYTGTTANGANSRGYTVGASGATFESASAGQLWVLQAAASGSYVPVFNGSVTLTGVGNGQLDGLMYGSGSLTKSGSGTWTLTANNTYTGTTLVNAGTLVINGIGSYSSAFTIANGTTLLVNSGYTYFYGNPSFNFTTNGGGTITGSSGNFILTANTAFTTLGGSQDVINGTTGINLNFTTATFNVARGTDPTADLLISSRLWNSNGGNIVKSGSGIMLLTASNDFYGTTRVSAGTLVLSNASALSGSTLDLNTNDSGTLTLGLAGATTYNLGGLQGGRNYSMGSNSFSVGGNVTTTNYYGFNTSSITTYSGVLSGSGGLTKVGLGYEVLTGSNTYSGPTLVSAGVLMLSNTNGPALYNGGTGTVTVAYNGAGGSGVYSGGLMFGAANQLGTNVDLVMQSPFNYTYLQMLGNNQTIGNLISGTNNPGSVVIENTEFQTGIGNSTLTITQTTNSTFSGYIRNTAGGSGTFSLVKNGAATLTFSSANITYTGLTTVNAGSLILNASGILNGAAVVNNGGTLQINESASIFPTYNTSVVTVNGGGTLTFAGSGANQDYMDYIGTITLSNSGGAAAMVTTPDGSGVRFGNAKNGTVNSYGTTTNTYGAIINLVNSSSGANPMTFNAGASNTLLISSVISDYTASGSYTGTPVTFSGSGTTILSKTNTYAGTTTVSGVTLLITGLLGNGSYAANITDNGSLIFSNTANQTLSGTISGTGSITKRGASTLTLSGNSSYTGGTFIDAGMVTLSGGSGSSGSTATLHDRQRCDPSGDGQHLLVQRHPEF